MRHPDPPDYEPMLTAYHAVFRHEPSLMVAQLPVMPGTNVLDVACGDAAYAPLLAEAEIPRTHPALDSRTGLRSAE